MKSELRKYILEQRKAMSQADVKEYSLEIINKLLNTEQYINSKCIMIYMSFNNEVDTSFLKNQILKDNKTLVISYTDTKSIDLYPLIINEDSAFVKNNYGYLEPDLALNEKANLSDIDLVIVPGVVFDRQKNRIGFGKGYYDRFLPKISSYNIALAYDFQVKKRIESDEYDIPMDMIITEKEII